ncbi:prostaglandin E2 receptor EP1 subtype-like [Brachyistius frenatus]|uniref:prostaglandin E2 receptor EP1 subtype-like n=1 Tax=Brachyistius frenatus TaxID=100188 RepID=UPI0037E98A12
MLEMQHSNYSGFTVPVPLSNNTTIFQKPEVGAIVAHNATGPPNNPTAAGLTMTLGILFNVVALIILVKAYNRFRRRSKATFLLFASCLVATDLAGHVIPGALVLSRYSAGTGSTATSNFREDPADPDTSCLFLGGCMVFFGLCPLFLGCAMAAERCLGVTKPLLHARLVTTARTKMALTLIWLLALCVALLPFFSLGAYTHQYPGTWCFIRVMEDTKATDLAFVMLFSGLALSSLGLAFVCNTISGITLVRARLKKRSCSQRCSARSHDTEMVVQLVGIMVTSCICWSPLLVFGLMSAIQSYRDSLFGDRDTYRGLMVTGVRMATCNQILDPWVYILLRRAILRKIYRLTKRQASFKGSTFRSVRWDVSSFQNSDKNGVKKS